MSPNKSTGTGAAFVKENYGNIKDFYKISSCIGRGKFYSYKINITIIIYIHNIYLILFLLKVLMVRFVNVCIKKPKLLEQSR